MLMKQIKTDLKANINEIQFHLRIAKAVRKNRALTKSPIGVSYQPKIEYCMVMKNTHMSCPISPQGHCRRGEKNEANFPTCIFRARLLVNRAARRRKSRTTQAALLFRITTSVHFWFCIKTFWIGKRDRH